MSIDSITLLQNIKSDEVIPRLPQFDGVLKVPKAGTLPTITLLVQASPMSQSEWGLGRRCQCPCGRSGSGFPHIEEIFNDCLSSFIQR